MTRLIAKIRKWLGIGKKTSPFSRPKRRTQAGSVKSSAAAQAIREGSGVCENPVAVVSPPKRVLTVRRWDRWNNVSSIGGRAPRRATFWQGLAQAPRSHDSQLACPRHGGELT